MPSYRDFSLQEHFFKNPNNPKNYEIIYIKGTVYLSSINFPYHQFMISFNYSTTSIIVGTTAKKKVKITLNPTIQKYILLVGTLVKSFQNTLYAFIERGLQFYMSGVIFYRLFCMLFPFFLNNKRYTSSPRGWILSYLIIVEYSIVCMYVCVLSRV